MALFTSAFFIEFDFVNCGFDVIDEEELAIHMIMELDEIQKIIIRRMLNRSDNNNSYESDNLVVNIFKTCTDDEEIISDEDDIELPPPDVIDSGAEDCPVVIRELDKEVSVLAGLPDPHAAVTDGSVSVDPLPRRRRYFASAWRRIKRSAQRLCCCVR